MDTAKNTGISTKKKNLKIILFGRPATKKNGSRIMRRGKATRLLPSEAFVKYENECLWQLKRYQKYKFELPIRIQCIYYLPNKANYPDLVGLMQATADILEKAQVIENDRLIVSWDGTYISPTLDKLNPRVEVIITDMNDVDTPDPYVIKKRAAKMQLGLF
ncbi:hypothetical protein [Pectinatus frisingensis]|uniref:hypothetical protein n=1 Tax=Pectinatus frisingensis TaxID=865 RepID=UPI001E4C8063|nr:hypothetical protein [Pectinatus frisingensis]